MGYEPSTRVFSLSFNRDPAEHADVMLEAGRRITTSTEPMAAWTGFGIAIGFGVVVGVVMEIHRRFILPLLLDPSEIASPGTVAAQLLPLILLLVALYAALLLRAGRRRRQAIISKLEPGRVVDVDIFTRGISMSSGSATVEVDWSGVSDILADGNRIELECEGFMIYIPARAFAGNAAYAAALKDIRHLWRDAVKLDHDRKMVEAGLD